MYFRLGFILRQIIFSVRFRPLMHSLSSESVDAIEGYRAENGITEPPFEPETFLEEVTSFIEKLRKLTYRGPPEPKSVEDLRTEMPHFYEALETALLRWNGSYFLNYELPNMNIYVDLKNLTAIDELVMENKAILQTAAAGMFLHKFYNGTGLRRNENNTIIGATLEPTYGRDINKFRIGKLSEPILQRLYAEEYGPNLKQTDTEVDSFLRLHYLVELIKHELMTRVFDLDWIDTLSKQRVIDKLNSIVARIAISPWILSNNRLSKYYEALPKFDENASFIKLASGLSRNSWNVMTTQMTAKAPPKGDILDDRQGPFQINARYYPRDDIITIFQGIMLTPLYEPDYPLEYVLGTIGVIIGHEITHSIDPNLVEREINGEILYPESKERMSKLAECYKNQYASYCIDPDKPGYGLIDLFHGSASAKICLGDKGAMEKMIGEIVSDDGGRRAAFLAMKTLENSGYRFSEIPGLENRTAEQIFFYGTAAFFCQSRSDFECMFMPTAHKHNITRVNRRNNLIDQWL